MRGLIFFITLSLIEMNQSTVAKNFSTCFASYCYFWNGNIAYDELSKPCPEEYWTLEVYDKGIQKNVSEFISATQNMKPTIVGYYVPLNLSCTSSTNCTWMHTNRIVTYFNWENGFDQNQENNVYYFRANTSSEANKWNRVGKNIEHPYAKLCMKGNEIIKTTFSTIHRTVNKTQNHPTTGDNLYMTLALAVVGMVLVILIGVVVFVIRRKRLQNGAMSSPSSATIKNKRGNTSVNNKIVQQSSNESGKTIYAEVPEAAEVNYNQNHMSMQYADLNWSTNILKIEQNDSKPVEDQKTNYFGPMGDVYARVQKS